MSSHTMDSAAAASNRVDIQLDNFAKGIETGKQIAAITVSGTIAELWGDDCALHCNEVDVAWGPVVVALAELGFPLGARWRQGMNLQFSAAGIGCGFQDVQMAAGHGIVIGFGVVVEVGYHHAGPDEAGIEVDVSIGDVHVFDTGQPDDFAQAKIGFQFGLDLALGPAGIAVAVDPATLSHDGGAMPIDFDTAAFPGQLAADEGGARLQRHVSCDGGVVGMHLLVAPAFPTPVMTCSAPRGP